MEPPAVAHLPECLKSKSFIESEPRSKEAATAVTNKLQRSKVQSSQEFKVIERD